MRFITDEAALQEHVGGPPRERSVRKQLSHLDEHARRFLAAAPFCVLATSGADGSCDATPRGDDPRSRRRRSTYCRTGPARSEQDRGAALPDGPSIAGE
jgi:predicted pyridoxine 5'-phosphate oxidase superfamily flavin-nucleotide-binding protein